MEWWIRCFVNIAFSCSIFEIDIEVDFVNFGLWCPSAEDIAAERKMLYT
jgi:hypothetical protein